MDGIFSNFNTDWLNNGDYGTIGNYASDYILDDNYGGGLSGSLDSGSSSTSGLDIGMLMNTLGRLGAGIGSGISAYQAGKQSAYIPATRWLGNGLAMTGLSSNLGNKKNALNQAYGSGRALSSLLGQGYSLFGNNKLNTNIGDNPSFDANYNIYGNPNYGIIGNAIDDYVRR